MIYETDEDRTIYQVVVNDEEQYSIWRADKPIPLGWRAIGVSGPKTVCLEHIEQTWTDMRPRSLREAMDRAEEAGESTPGES
jgi:MbtH protein